jgi:anti-sigma regulatory factor (Ser/Thr protein kinase)
MTEDRERLPPDVELEFGNDVEAPRRARRAVGSLFPRPEPIADDVALVTSELVSNVVRHTDDGGRMQAWADDPLRVEVHDTDFSLPTPRADADVSGGRGLRIVDNVADEWGAYRDENGKTLWAEFRRRHEQQSKRRPNDGDRGAI